MKAAQHTLPVGFAKSVEKVECFNDMIEILYVGEESEEMVLPCKISFTKDWFIIYISCPSLCPSLCPSWCSSLCPQT